MGNRNMKKKVYVFITSKEIKFCFEWFQQCEPILKREKGVIYRAFSYKDNSESSLVEALKEAKRYAQENNPNQHKIPTIQELVEEYIIYYGLETLEESETFDFESSETDIFSDVNEPWVDEETLEKYDYEEDVSGTWENTDLKENVIKKEIVNLHSLSNKAEELKNALLKKIIGQDTVIDRFIESYFMAEKKFSIIERKKGPKNVYLFAGTPGVGKTFMAETFAEIINLPYKRFDMAGYSGKEALEGLIGFERTYRDSQPGVLTAFVEENPQCVLLFDEIEKASSGVILNFLQILDDGCCYDKYTEKRVSFHEAILIFTTNVGKQLYEGAEEKELSSLPEKKIIAALEKDINPETNLPYFPAAIASRLSSYTILLFNHLKASDMIRVVEQDIQRTEVLNKKNYKMRMIGTKLLAPTILYSLGGKADARNASKKAGQYIEQELYKFLILAGEKMEVSQKNAIRFMKWEVDYEDADEEVVELYEGIKNTTIVVYGDISVEDSYIFQEKKVNLIVTTDEDVFKKAIHSEQVLFAVIDYTYGRKESDILSVVNCNSKGRNMFEIAREDNPEVKIYVFDRAEKPFKMQEKSELQKKGCHGYLMLEQEGHVVTLLEEKYKAVSYELCMDKLFYRHQVLMFDTEHYFDVRTRNGRIKITNLRLETVIEAEDESTFIGADVMPNLHWDAVRVSDKLKEELKLFIDYLKNPKLYHKKNLRMPKGVLLYGPPGTGKTSLAKVVATESGLNFIAVGADELRTGGEKRVQELFQTARKYAPVVLFIDEIDAIGMNREKTGMNSVLNRLLIEMDGFKKADTKPVFVMAATNLGDKLDPALDRRFDKKVEIPLPNNADRKWLFLHFMEKNKELFSEVTEEEINSLMIRSDGLNPALIENVVEAAMREAIRRDVKVSDIILDRVFEEQLFGEEHKGIKTEDFRHTAVHEAGHVLCNCIVGVVPSYMTIIGRGNYGGYMISGKEEKQHLSKNDYLNRICTTLGGRAAELVFYGEEGLTLGIGKDIKDATWYAKKMVCSWAMYEKEVGLGVITEEELHHNAKAKEQINQILAEQMERAIEMVETYKDIIEALVEKIMASDSKRLTKQEIARVFKERM